MTTDNLFLAGKFDIFMVSHFIKVNVHLSLKWYAFKHDWSLNGKQGKKVLHFALNKLNP